MSCDISFITLLRPRRRSSYSPLYLLQRLRSAAFFGKRISKLRRRLGLLLSIRPRSNDIRSLLDCSSSTVSSFSGGLIPSNCPPLPLFRIFISWKASWQLSFLFGIIGSFKGDSISLAGVLLLPVWPEYRRPGTSSFDCLSRRTPLNFLEIFYSFFDMAALAVSTSANLSAGSAMLFLWVNSALMVPTCKVNSLQIAIYWAVGSLARSWMLRCQLAVPQISSSWPKSLAKKVNLTLGLPFECTLQSSRSLPGAQLNRRSSWAAGSNIRTFLHFSTSAIQYSSYFLSYLNAQQQGLNWMLVTKTFSSYCSAITGVGEWGLQICFMKGKLIILWTMQFIVPVFTWLLNIQIYLVFAPKCSSHGFITVTPTKSEDSLSLFSMKYTLSSPLMGRSTISCLRFSCVRNSLTLVTFWMIFSAMSLLTLSWRQSRLQVRTETCQRKRVQGVCLFLGLSLQTRLFCGKDTFRENSHWNLMLRSGFPSFISSFLLTQPIFFSSAVVMTHLLQVLLFFQTMISSSQFQDFTTKCPIFRIRSILLLFSSSVNSKQRVPCFSFRRQFRSYPGFSDLVSKSQSNISCVFSKEAFPFWICRIAHLSLNSSFPSDCPLRLIGIQNPSVIRSASIGTVFPTNNPFLKQLTVNFSGSLRTRHPLRIGRIWVWRFPSMRKQLGAAIILWVCFSPRRHIY